jgi:hypothetical protein
MEMPEVLGMSKAAFLMVLEVEVEAPVQLVQQLSMLVAVQAVRGLLIQYQDLLLDNYHLLNTMLEVEVEVAQTIIVEVVPEVLAVVVEDLIEVCMVIMEQQIPVAVVADDLGKLHLVA